MLKTLSLKNFQSLRETATFDFAPITFLYGPNSVGKSAVLDALTIIRSFLQQDANLQGLIADSTRDIYFNFDNDQNPWIGNDEHPTISLTLLVDNLKNNNDGENLEIPASLLTKLKSDLDGDVITLEVIFPRYGGIDPRKVSLFIGDSEILSYSSEFIIYDVNYNQVPLSASEESGVQILPQLVGELRVSKTLLDNIGLPAGWLPSESRPGCLVFEDQGPSFLIRGLQFSLIPGTAFIEISEDATNLCIPPRGLLSETPAPHFVELLSAIRSCSEKLSIFIRRIFALIGESLTFHHVKGDRLPVSSDRPLHLKSKIDANYPDGEHGQRWSGLFEGTRCLSAQSDMRTMERDALLALYVRDFNSPHGRSATLHEEDFPNFAVQRYMHSLRRYKFSRDAYYLMPYESIESGDEVDQIKIGLSADPFSLAGSMLVYFSVRENPVGSRRFDQVGSSLGFLLPVLIALGEEQSCAIEEPELHLHPLAQEELADVLIHASRSDRIILVESHSEALLHKVSQRIKESHELTQSGTIIQTPLSRALTVNAEDVAVHVFSKDSNNQAHATKVQFAPDGTLIDDWPDNIFDNSWRAALGRIHFFSKAINRDEVAEDWPWLGEVHATDERVAELLTLCWQCQRLGPGFVEPEITQIGRIAERALLRLLAGFSNPQFRAGRNTKPAWRDELVRYLHKGTPLSLGWWKQTLTELKRTSREFDDQVVDYMRNRISAATWGKQWESLFLKGNLLPRLDELMHHRNQASHYSEKKPSLEAIERLRGLAYLGRKPGGLLVALGFVSQDGSSRPRLVQ